MSGIKNFAIWEKSRKSRNEDCIHYVYHKAGGGEAKEFGWGGVLKCFEGKSGDGKNFWRQGGGILINF